LRRLSAGVIITPVTTPLEVAVAPAARPAPLAACRFRFPDPRRAGADGLVAGGGDLEPSTLIAAYRRGIFPWPAEGVDLLWWSPDPRAVIPVDGLHVSRRLRQTLGQQRFRVTIDADFAGVIAACADRGDDETWITPALRAAYERLHALGWAHSVEVWTTDGALAGGLYGVAIGGLFAAESMFHRVTDASKVALVALVQQCRASGVDLIDVQMPSPHLASMGAVTVPRRDYLHRLADVADRAVNFTAVRSVPPVE
jgi:leucyl/phenylalanyl-tRNA--protein transferase